MKKRKRNSDQYTLPIFLWILCIFLAGCGSAVSKTEVYTIAETAAAAANGAADTGWYEEADFEEEAGETASSDSSFLQTAARKLIRTVEMNVETDQFDSLLHSIRERVDTFSGYIEQSDVSGQRTNYQGNPIPRSACLTVRIPSVKLDSFTSAVEDGANVTNRTENTRDVTLQYSDIESRKKSLTIEQERLWELLEKADSLESVIALEERLSEIRYELESMESQLRLYDNQIDYSTVYLYIDEVTVYTPTAPETISERLQHEFTRNLNGMSEFCINLFIAVLAGSPIWIPLFFIAALLLIPVKRRHWKKQLKQKAMKETEGVSSENS